MKTILCVALLLVGCDNSRGGIDEKCNRDGSCNSGLVCRPQFVSIGAAGGHVCVPK